MNPMRTIELEKVTLNVGVGEGGDKLDKVERVLTGLAGRKPARTLAKKTIREWRVRLGEPIGHMLTFRGRAAEAMLERLLRAVDNRLTERCFDSIGNFSFGIREYIDIPGVGYDPEIGMFGMDVCVSLQRPGYRIRHRRRQRRAIPHAHRISKQEAMGFVHERFGVRVEA